MSQCVTLEPLYREGRLTGRELDYGIGLDTDRYCERVPRRIPEDRREDVVHALRVLVDAIDDLPAM